MNDAEISNRVSNLERHAAIADGTFEMASLPNGIEQFVPSAYFRASVSPRMPDDKRKAILDLFPTLRGIAYESPANPVELRNLPPNLAAQDKLLRDLYARQAQVLRPLHAFLGALPEVFQADGPQFRAVCGTIEAVLSLTNDCLSNLVELRRDAIITHMGCTRPPAEDVDLLFDPSELCAWVTTTKALQQQARSLQGVSTGNAPRKKGKKRSGKGKQSSANAESVSVPQASESSLQADAPAPAPRPSDGGGGESSSRRTERSVSRNPNARSRPLRN
ncbi:hypothetical protein GGI21_004457 [Coemansia aciculifera]|uniref:Uncharacterized protein n=1 Tax=Coemansia aciculifera TaxID=417176 RepID=A0ACC1M3E6_9FUNG|nr:hypothetical protein IWW38_003099 [Coemansia aciculifera]KAJ2903231.1 hypothetical protein GGI21_004457 [Coemansia aciculifera]